MRDLKIKIHANICDVLFLITMTFVVAFPNPSMFKALSIILFFSYTIFLSVYGHKKTKNLLQYVWAIGFYLLCYLSKVWSVYPAAISDVITNVQWSFMVSIAVVNYIVIYKLSVIDIAKRMLIIGVIFLVDIILNGVYIDGRFTVIIDGYEINENTFGQIALGIVSYLFFWSKKTKWKNMFINGLIIILIIFALISGSRKCLISLAIYIILFMMYEHPSRDFIKFFAKVAGVAFVLGMIYVCIMNIDVLYSSVGMRIESLLVFLEGDIRADGSVNARFLMIQQALEMFSDKPILGYGLNTFAYITRFGAYAHNNYVELLANVGIVGFLIFYIPIFGYLLKAYNNWKKDLNESIVPLTIFSVYLVNDFANVSYFSIVGNVFRCLAIGLCISASIDNTIGD